jgi:hypothetical protein
LRLGRSCLAPTFQPESIDARDGATRHRYEVLTDNALLRPVLTAVHWDV